MTPCALRNESCGLRLLAFTGGLRPGLALLLCLSCVESLYFGPANRAQLECRGKTNSVCFLLLACCLLPRWVGKKGVTIAIAL